MLRTVSVQLIRRARPAALGGRGAFRALSTQSVAFTEPPAPTHTDTDVENLKLLHRLAAQSADATLYREVVERHREVNGDRHPDTLNSISLLASLLQEQGDFDAAEPLAREAAESWEGLMGRYHESSLIAMSNLSQLLTARGKYTEAEPLARGALEVARDIFGSRKRDTLVALSNLAQTLAAQGQYEEAEPLMREDLALSIAIIGPAQPDTLVSYSNLAQLLALQGKFGAPATPSRAHPAPIARGLSAVARKPHS